MKTFTLALAFAGIGLSGLVLAFSEQRPATPQPTTANTQEDPNTFRARDVLGMTVKDPQSQAVGTVDDLVIDGRNGQVQYAVVALGADQNERLVVMPWTILQTQYGPNPDQRFIVLDMEPQRIQSAPVVTRSQWPGVVYSEWGEWQPRIDKYYKMEVERKQKRRGDKIKIKEKIRVDD